MKFFFVLLLSFLTVSSFAGKIVPHRYILQFKSDKKHAEDILRGSILNRNGRPQINQMAVAAIQASQSEMIELVNEKLNLRLQPLRSYTHIMNGVAVVLSPVQVKAIN